MDYEVFVVGRIKEAYDQGMGWEQATVDGVARTGRIVSAAAVLLAISLFAVVTSGVTFVRMFGLGTGLAIVVDATLVRGVLLPAAMRLTKDAAWWAPRWLRRAHRRVGIGEEQPQVISMG
jgi:RND superfamily putative drug exporter